MAFSNRILDVTFILHHLTEIDLDVIIKAEEPPHIVLDTVITAAYGVEDDGGDINEYTAIRVTKPAVSGDKIVYLPPNNPDYDRHSREIIIGETGEENSTDIYRGDITVFPGKAVGGIGKSLMLKSSSGIASFDIPDTPIITSVPTVYDANELFELGGMIPGAYQSIQWDKSLDSWFADKGSLVQFSPKRLDLWISEDKGSFELLFDPIITHINSVRITSKDVRLKNVLVKGYLPFPFENGKITVELAWNYGSELDKELKSRNVSLEMTLEVWDLRLGSIIKYSETSNIGFGEGYFDKIKPLSRERLFPQIGGGTIEGPNGRALVGTGADESVSFFSELKYHGMDVCLSSLAALGTHVRHGDDDETIKSLEPRIYSASNSSFCVNIKTKPDNPYTNVGSPIYLGMNNLTNEYTILVSW